MQCVKRKRLCSQLRSPESYSPYISPLPPNPPSPETLMRFDFEAPHYPGSLVHDLANVRRFNEINLTRVPGVVGHIVRPCPP